MSEAPLPSIGSCAESKGAGDVLRTAADFFATSGRVGIPGRVQGDDLSGDEADKSAAEAEDPRAAFLKKGRLMSIIRGADTNAEDFSWYK